MSIQRKLIVLPLIVAGTIASAQDVRYLGYGANYASGDGTDILSLGGTVDYTNNGFIFNGGASYADVEGDNLTALNFRLGYVIDPKIALYVGANFLGDGDDDISSYNIGGEYGVGPYTVGLNVEQLDESGADASPSLYAGYKFSEAYEVSLVVADAGDETSVTLVSDFDMGATELAALYGDVGDVSFFAFDGAYDLGNRFRIGAGYATFDDGIDSIDLFSVSGGYEASEDLWIDIGYADAEGTDLVSLSITFETGRETLLIDRAETAAVDALGTFGNVLGGGF